MEGPEAVRTLLEQVENHERVVTRGVALSECPFNRVLGKLCGVDTVVDTSKKQCGGDYPRSPRASSFTLTSQTEVSFGAGT